jgi:hypothetical protein
MHMTLHRWLASAALALAHTSVVHAADPEQPAGSDATESRALIAAGADLAVASDYLWRGFLENQTISVQPNLWMTVGDFTVSSWMNASRVGPNGRSLTERDLTLDYTHAFGSWTLSGGWINYTFVDVSVDRYSNEFYGSLAYAGYFSPTLHVFQDVQQGSGSYVSVGVSHEYSIWRGGVTLSPQMSLGYNRRQWIDASTMSDANVGLTLSVPLMGDRLRVAPAVNYSKALDKALFDDHLYWAVTLSVH